MVKQMQNFIFFFIFEYKWYTVGICTFFLMSIYMHISFKHLSNKDKCFKTYMDIRKRSTYMVYHWYSKIKKYEILHLFHHS